MATLKKGARITGAERNKLAGELKKAYDKGRASASSPTRTAARTGSCTACCPSRA